MRNNSTNSGNEEYQPLEPYKYNQSEINQINGSKEHPAIVVIGVLVLGFVLGYIISL